MKEKRKNKKIVKRMHQIFIMVLSRKKKQFHLFLVKIARFRAVLMIKVIVLKTANSQISKFLMNLVFVREYVRVDGQRRRLKRSVLHGVLKVCIEAKEITAQKNVQKTLSLDLMDNVFSKNTIYQ